MNSIVKRTDVFATDVSPIQKDALAAHYNPKIKELAKRDFAKEIIQAITKAYVVTGSRVPDTFEMICDEVISELKSLFTTYTVEEVCMAIDMGSKGKLSDKEEVIYVSVTNILRWIHRFNDLVRKEAIYKQRQFEEKQEKIEDQKQSDVKVKDFEKAIIRYYESFPIGFKAQSKGYLAAMYRHLDKKGLIMLTVDRKKAIFNAVIKIKDRTKWMRKPLLELTAKELSEYRALYIVFVEWKELGFNLKEEIKLS